MARFKAGERVRLRGKHLRSTGQYTGRAPASVWEVRACECGMCSDGAFVATNERLSEVSLRSFTADEIASCPGLVWRHFAAANLERVRGVR